MMTLATCLVWLFYAYPVVSLLGCELPGTQTHLFYHCSPRVNTDVLGLWEEAIPAFCCAQRSAFSKPSVVEPVLSQVPIRLQPVFS